MEKKIALEKLKIERETEEEKIKMIHLKEQYARKMQRQQLQEQIQQRKQNNPNGGDNEIYRLQQQVDDMASDQNYSNIFDDDELDNDVSQVHKAGISEEKFEANCNILFRQ